MIERPLQRRSTNLFIASIVALALSCLFGYWAAMAVAMVPDTMEPPRLWWVGAVIGSVGGFWAAVQGLRRGYATQSPSADPGMLTTGWKFLGLWLVLLLIGFVWQLIA